LGMIMSVSTLIICNGAATPSSLVNLSIGRVLGIFPATLMAAESAGVKRSAERRMALMQNGCHSGRANPCERRAGIQYSPSVVADDRSVVASERYHPIEGDRDDTCCRTACEHFRHQAASRHRGGSAWR